MVTPRFDHSEINVHGGADPAELRNLGLDPDQVLDFSANLNPFGPSPAARRALAVAPLDRYPDRVSHDLRRELAIRNGLEDEQVLVGNGSCELIWLASLAYLSADDDVLILGPTFGDYARSARLTGAIIRTCEAASLDDFCPPISRLAIELYQHRPKLVFLATPNNPTGQTISPETIFDLAEAHSRTLFVVDEAYRDCLVVPGPAGPVAPANVLRLRSLTKMHGLAGLRLGYALGETNVIMALQAVQPSWSVNAPAQLAGLQALRDTQHLKDCLTRWIEAKHELTDQLRKAGFAPIDSAVPFFLLPVSDAARFRSMLLQSGILVRDCSSFGLPGYVRISSRGKAENARLVEALIKTRAEVALCRD